MDFKKFRKELRREDSRRLSKLDYILLFSLLFIYSLFAFINLGSVRAPQTSWKVSAGQTAIIDLGETKNVNKISFFVGNNREGSSIAVYDESSFVDGLFQPDETEDLGTVSLNYYNDVFKWFSVDTNTYARYLVVWIKTGETEINEIAVMNQEDGLLPVEVYQPQGGLELLVDEQNAVVTDPSYLDEMYFDEIYHARTAYEILKNDDLVHEMGREAASEEAYSICETTHPSLGKVFIALGIRIFGMTPFGWRFAGTFFGVLILAVLYVFGKRIFRRSDYAFITAALFAVDGMHFAQTRIATIDTYALFFTLLMFLFMGDYIAEDFEERPFWKKLLMLGLCGLSFGLGVSSKWTCLYSGVGLALLYFGDLIYNVVRYLIRYFEKDRGQRKKIPVNVAAYLPVLFVFVILILHISGKWCDWDNYRILRSVGGELVWKLDPERVGLDTIDRVLLKPWFYGTLLALTGVAVASSVVFRLAFRKRDDVDLTLNDLLMTPVWCCLFFIVIPIVIYACANSCYFITDNCKTFKDELETLWKQQCGMYNYHAFSVLDATHPCQSEWYQWPLMQKSVWFYGGGTTKVGEVKYVSNIVSTGNPAIWYVSAFGAVFALVEWFRNPESRKDRRVTIAVAAIIGMLALALLMHVLDHMSGFLVFFVLSMIGTMLLVYNVEKRYPREGWRDRSFFVVLTGVLAGLLPWTFVKRCVFLYHYFSTIPFMMLLVLLLLLCVEKKHPRTWWLKWAWLGVSALVFLLMLPAISGIPCTKAYARFIENVLAPFGKVFY